MRKGFTLIELLIASAIFAIVMMLATGVFGWASTYNGKLRDMRNASQSIRSANEMISKDVRLANGKFTINLGGATDVEIPEIALMYCQNLPTSSCTVESLPGATSYYPTILNIDPADNSIADPTTPSAQGQASNANGLIIIQKDQNKFVFYRNIKFSTSNNYDLYRYESALSATGVQDISMNVYGGGNRTSPIGNWVMLNSSRSSLQVAFAGYAVNKKLLLQQPYVDIAMRGQNWDYEHLSTTEKVRLDSRTAVETRDYNSSY